MQKPIVKKCWPKKTFITTNPSFYLCFQGGLKVQVWQEINLTVHFLSKAINIKKSGQRRVIFISKQNPRLGKHKQLRNTNKLSSMLHLTHNCFTKTN